VVTVIARRDAHGRLASLAANGHADWSTPRGGADEYDLVCAAVSAVLQAAWLGLTDVAGVEVRADKADGRLSLRWPEATRSDAAVAAIVGTAERAIEALAAQFPAHVAFARETEP
jgi:uncharacterized protein YsxB (DUF464 family)